MNPTGFVDVSDLDGGNDLDSIEVAIFGLTTVLNSIGNALLVVLWRRTAIRMIFVTNCSLELLWSCLIRPVLLLQ